MAIEIRRLATYLVASLARDGSFLADLFDNAQDVWESAPLDRLEEACDRLTDEVVNLTISQGVQRDEVISLVKLGAIRALFRYE